MKATGCTHIGSRQNNEDSYGIEELDDTLLLTVADGLGGYNAGEVASILAVKEIRDTVMHYINTADTHRELLKMAIEKANTSIIQQARSTSEYSGMATTIVTALVHGNIATIANVGDSRAYCISQERITQVTKDHSLVQSLINMGAIDEEEAFGHPQKHVVLRSLGMEKAVKADFYEEKIVSGDILLLCSDGLTDALKKSEIKDIVVGSEQEEICTNLLEAARIKSNDNITIVVAYSEGSDMKS